LSVPLAVSCVTWTDLFERAADREVTVEQIRETLADRRGPDDRDD
jgi:hypothetical protein